MISRLNGILLEKKPPYLLLDVGGVGYEVQASMQTFSQLPEIGTPTLLHTHFIVREDAQLLFGFAHQHERSLFRALLKVNGIGPKSALAILSSMETDKFVHCITEKNAAALQSLPGIGKKTAERLIEMQDRLADWQTHDGEMGELFGEPQGNKKVKAEQDAVSALISLGFKPQEASRAITKVFAEHLSSEELIRLALKGVTQ
jgi:Holliday junction DNA helicase RuvA